MKYSEADLMHIYRETFLTDQGKRCLADLMAEVGYLDDPIVVQSHALERDAGARWVIQLILTRMGITEDYEKIVGAFLTISVEPPKEEDQEVADTK